jgi:hypothetical protein
MAGGMGIGGGQPPEQTTLESVMGWLSRLRDGFGPSMLQRMNEHTNRSQAMMKEQGLAAAMRDPELLKSGTDIAGAFDFTGGMGLGAGIIRAYHGSPHTFDKFDMSKLGSGEGAQAYGHGLYFAENPKVAEQYKAALSQQSVSRDGVTISYADLRKRVQDNPGDYDAQAMLQYANFGDVKKAKANAATRLKAAQGGDKHNGSVEYWQATHDALKGLAKQKIEPGGSHYTVDLDVNHEDLLDWDAPLSQQPEKVRKALEGLVDPADMMHPPERMTGSGIYSHLNQNPPAGSKMDPAASSQALRAAGIPGIRYLDGGSRTDGDGTRNFVLFDDQLAKIVERNGMGIGR